MAIKEQGKGRTAHQRTVGSVVGVGGLRFRTRFFPPDTPRNVAQNRSRVVAHIRRIGLQPGDKTPRNIVGIEHAALQQAVYGAQRHLRIVRPRAGSKAQPAAADHIGDVVVRIARGLKLQRSAERIPDSRAKQHPPKPILQLWL